jgi:hypothetical protein
MTRYARYAAAVIFTLFALAFVGLWVRSYYRADALYGYFKSDCSVEFHSHRGVAGCIIEFDSADNAATGRWWLQSRAVDPVPLPGSGFSLSLDPWPTWVTIPHWFLAASSLGLAALFAFKRTWRYSLRTILVATTLLAGLLGLAVYSI